MIRILIASLLLVLPLGAYAQNTLLHVSYDPTREFYEAYNARFMAEHATTKIRMSHGGSGKQARSVIDGLKADVVSLALAHDIDTIAKKTGLLPLAWQGEYMNKSVPMYSTIVFLVRKGNPKQIKDWPDLIKDGVEVVTPNPKTSGGARWNYLAAYAYGLKANARDAAKAREFVGKVFSKVRVFDTAARAASMTFARRNRGDVLITWENGAYLAKAQFGNDAFEIVYPSISIRADTPVAVVAENAKANGTTLLARAYVAGLFLRPVQELAVQYHFRPINTAIVTPFPAIEMVGIEELGGWQTVHAEHFADGAAFDAMLKK